ncbi:universal stress protein UspA [Kineosporia sp. NBRC 101677]|uniref:universal stress protein n=1 Tax=Kineosporia sp. NBRC 101677 TaxID=3032197 RepID=UPI0024A29377|nr:universal stress protein [Kineosporia sp. NBRC 101677]GLY17007.1 universal stress protein UspA [Kineosporia sp. NBRC 101677]
MTYSERKTVVGHDGTPAAAAALDWAAADAARRGSELLVMQTDERGWADALARVRRLAPEVPVTLTGTGRSLAEASGRAEMIVLGAPAAGSPQATVVSEVVARAGCPVVVVRPDEPGPASGLPVSVGYDGSACAERALSFAAERAAQWQVPLVVVVAQAPLTADPQTLGAQAAAWVLRRHPGLEVRHEVAEGEAVPALAAASRGCGLIVVGSRGRALAAGVLDSSVGDGLISRSQSPLAVVH